MTPPQNSPSPKDLPPEKPESTDPDAQRADPHEPELDDFGRSLQEVAASLRSLQDRHAQVLAAQARQHELRTRLSRTQSELRQHRTRQLQDELKEIKRRLEELDVILESQLFTWSSLKEPFWQAVRFGGIGIIIGWVLRAIAS